MPRGQEAQIEHYLCEFLISRKFEVPLRHELFCSFHLVLKNKTSLKGFRLRFRSLIQKNDPMQANEKAHHRCDVGQRDLVTYLFSCRWICSTTVTWRQKSHWLFVNVIFVFWKDWWPDTKWSCSKHPNIQREYLSYCQAYSSKKKNLK